MLDGGGLGGGVGRPSEDLWAGCLGGGVKQPFDHVLHLLRPVLVILLRVLGELDVGASTHQNDNNNNMNSYRVPLI